MTVEQIKEKIRDAEASCVSEIMDYMDGGEVDVLVVDVYPKRNVEKSSNLPSDWVVGFWITVPT